MNLMYAYIFWGFVLLLVLGVSAGFAYAMMLPFRPEKSAYKITKDMLWPYKKEDS